MPMPTLKSNDNWHLFDFTMNICVKMFSHIAVTGQSEHDHPILQGQREPSSEQDLGAEPITMELVCPDCTREDIQDLYQDVFKLWRLPIRGWCEEATEEHLCQDILSFLKECLQLKWPSAQPEGKWGQMPANVPLPDCHLEFAAANCCTYEGLTAVQQDSCEGMLAIVRGAHWQAPVVAAVFKKIEWMCHSISQQCSGSCHHSGSCWCSGSHWHRWSRSSRWWKDP